jgi:uncharacterized protein (TIRG00374 family)
MSAHPSPVRKIVVNLLKVGFVVLVFWWLGRKDLISIDKFMAGLRNWPLIAAGFAALFAGSLLTVLRWNLLLRAQGIRLETPRLLQLHFVGLFFNVALPGAVSGDFVKAFYIGREVEGNRAKAFGSILFDRVVGLSALVMVSVFALMAGMEHFRGTPVLAGVKAFVLVAGTGVVAFYAYLFLVRENHDPVLRVLQHLESRNAKLGSLTRIYLGVRFYHSEKKVVTQALLVSGAVHTLAAFACLCFARALGETQLPVDGLFVVVPLGLLVTAVPVLPGGVGTGHAAFSFFFQLLGSARGADVFNYNVLSQLFFGGIGGLVYLRFKAKSPELAAGFRSGGAEPA